MHPFRRVFGFVGCHECVLHRDIQLKISRPLSFRSVRVLLSIELPVHTIVIYDTKALAFNWIQSHL